MSDAFLFYLFRELCLINYEAFVGAFADDVHPIIGLHLEHQTPTINLGELHFCDDLPGRAIG